MPRVLGMDPGTVSLDLCGLDDGQPFLDATFPLQDGKVPTERVLEALRTDPPPDLIVGPSGYGLPLVPIQRLRTRDLRLAFLAHPRERGGIWGLTDLILQMRRARLPVVFVPGAIHLPTIPAYRKANRIDLGTADKVCAVALAIWDQSRRLGIPPAEAAFLLVELGGAFSAVLAVEGGRIVDGLGGTSGPVGYRARGAMDGELAYLLGAFSKDVLFTGGVAFIAGEPHEPPEALLPRAGPGEVALRTLLEGVEKAVAALGTVCTPREILLSGRLPRSVPGLAGALESRLRRFAPVRQVLGFARVAKEAAQGAALVADGLCGGPHREIVEALHIREAAGTVLDYLYAVDRRRLLRRLGLRPA
jgi:predicted butyrate kinase (DUF1464 family)